MSGTDHKHPTFGVCECGHMDFMHPWTSGERVDYQGKCIADLPTSSLVNDDGSRYYGPWQPCPCVTFHADSR